MRGTRTKNDSAFAGSIPSALAISFAQARRQAEIGIGTGGAQRNWNSYVHEVKLPADAPEWWRGILCDPQTSGGLLIACSNESVRQVLEPLRSRNFESATIVGEFSLAQLRVCVR